MKPVLFDGFYCRYPVIKDNAKNLGWEVLEGEEECATTQCNIIWIDTTNILERYSSVERWQRMNHFPGMTNIARKSRMAQHLQRMRKQFKSHYSFYPTTWVLPWDMGELERNVFDENGVSPSILICKPDSGAQGKGLFSIFNHTFLRDHFLPFLKYIKLIIGIFLTRNLCDIPAQECVVVQSYVRKPLLIDGYKFDLRIYVYVSRCSPLRVFLV